MTEQPDWSPLLEADTLTAMTAAAASLLDAETFSASSTCDALAVSPDGSTVRYAHDEGGQLWRVTANDQTVVDDIRYDAKGRRSPAATHPLQPGSPTYIGPKKGGKQ